METKIGLTSWCTYFRVEAYDTGNQITSNPYALTSRLYQRDHSGAIRANENSVVCVTSPFAGITPKPQLAGTPITVWPNPFGPTASIAYSISSPAEVKLRIYDVSGRLVQTLVDGVRAKGEYSVSWDSRDARGMEAPPGVYFLRLETGTQVRTGTIVLLR